MKNRQALRGRRGVAGLGVGGGAGGIKDNVRGQDVRTGFFQQD